MSADQALGVKADSHPLENPGCGGKTSLMLAGIIALGWRWLR